jgi:phosphoglycerate dehydrogenase-like enzyme
MPKFVFLPPQTDATRRWADQLRSEGPDGVDIVEVTDPDQAAEVIADADAAFGSVPVDLLAHAPGLRWLQAPAAAPPPGYFYPELVEHPVEVTNFRGIYSDHVPIHAMALVLALSRNLPHYSSQQMHRTWDPIPDESSVIHLPEATALIVGVGGIGSALVGYCRAFGMRVLGTDARITEHADAEIHKPDDLDDLLPQADVVILTIPHTPQTEGLIDSRRFGLMKNSAVLVNIGRGPTVRLDDLVHALNTGEIAGAGLDVFETEPLPADHPLWHTPGAILTPHVAATGPYLDDRRYEVLSENVRRFAAGQPLINVVDKSQWF